MADEWLGKEMLRQAELRVSAQAAVLSALEARAASLLNLCSGGVLAAGAAMFTAAKPLGYVAAVVAAVLVGAGAHLLYALRARSGWLVPGFRPKDLAPYAEFEQDESQRAMAASLDDGIPSNSARLDTLGAAVNLAAWVVLLAPVIGGVAALFLRR